MKKSEYIKEQIEKRNQRKIKLVDEYHRRIESIDEDIKYYENLSDEDFEKILERERNEDLEIAILDKKLAKKLKKFGITREEFDNVPIDDIENFIQEKINGK